MTQNKLKTSHTRIGLADDPERRPFYICLRKDRVYKTIATEELGAVFIVDFNRRWEVISLAIIGTEDRDLINHLTLCLDPQIQKLTRTNKSRTIKA